MSFLLRRKNLYIHSPSHFLCSVSFVCFLLCQILHPLIHMKPPMCFLFCLFPPLTWFIFLLSGHPFVTLSEFSVCCAAMFSSFLIYSLLFGISPPSYCLQSVTVALLSRGIREQRQLPRAPPRHAPSAVKPHFPSSSRSTPAAAPGNQKASSEQEAQGQLLILKTVLICPCLISLMLIPAAPTSTLGCWPSLVTFFPLSLRLIKSRDKADSSGNLSLVTLALCVRLPRTFIHPWAYSN